MATCLALTTTAAILKIWSTAVLVYRLSLAQQRTEIIQSRQTPVTLDITPAQMEMPH